MLGHKAREFKQHQSISLEDLVPGDNFYRQVERSIDLSFFHDLADEFYSSMERPSVDPVVFFKLQLIAFFEGIRSERQLMETFNLALAHRWFIGYDLDEPVPDHSSLTKIITRQSSFGMSLTKILMFVHKEKYSLLFLDEEQSRYWFTGPKQECATLVRLRAHAQAAKVDGTFSVRSSRNTSIKRRLTDKLKRI